MGFVNRPSGVRVAEKEELMEEIIDCGPDELLFIEERLGTDPPDSEEERVGIWVAIQKAKYSYGMLNSEQVAQLEAVPGWNWSL